MYSLFKDAWRWQPCVKKLAAFSITSAALVKSKTLSCNDTKPLFRFGVITDIQYSDIPDGCSFNGKEKRYFRGGLMQIGKAVTLWNNLAKPELSFIVQLGDLIDGQNAGKYGAGLEFSSPQSEVALNSVLAEFIPAKQKIYHAIGNHELYNFSWDRLREKLNNGEQGWKVSDPGKKGTSQGFYFTFRPVEGWTFIMLNPYEVAVEGHDQSSPNYKRAHELLTDYNPNYGKPGDFTKGLVGIRKKYLPFNGGFGEAQLKWLKHEVVNARDRGDRIIVLSHVTLNHLAATRGTVVWDHQECTKILQEDGAGKVVAVLTGHKHDGGYVKDEEGIHHCTLQAVLIHEEAFGYVDVYEDRLELRGSGSMVSRTLPFTC